MTDIMFSRKTLSILALIVAVLLLITGCAPNKDAGPAESTTVDFLAVSVAVDATTLLGEDHVNAQARDVLAKLIAEEKADENGVFFAAQTVLVQEGSTAFDALLATRLPVSSSGYGASTLVSAILSLGNGAAGAASGWLYLVNGEVPDVSAGAYVVAADDTIVWRYTVTGGKDIDY